jgi:hypothetical protein
MNRCLLVAGVAAALCLPTCTAPREDSTKGRSAAPSPSKRSATRPHHARVLFLALGEPALRLHQAERDLKKVGIWDRLTEHLYEVKVAVRPGRSHIPQDRHLADAYPSAVAAPGGFGSLCDIAIYPAAIANDLARWRRYHAAGRLEAIPPDNLRQYWGSILAHELAHCLDHGSGEQSAERWERKALDGLRGRADP